MVNLFQSTIDNIMLTLNNGDTVEATLNNGLVYPVQVSKTGDYYIIQNMESKSKAFFTHNQLLKELLKIDMFTARKLLHPDDISKNKILDFVNKKACR